MPTLPLPAFSNPVGGGNQSGLLGPDFRYDRVNGFEFAQPYNVALGPNRSLIVTPMLFTATAPMLKTDFSALTDHGAYRIGGYVTASRRSDDLQSATPVPTENALRGYVDGIARFQLSPNWSLSGSLRYASDKTFLRRYDISRDARLRSNVSLERISQNAYFAINGWYVQTLRVNDRQGLQPIALPEIDWRYRFDDGILGGKVQLQANSLAISRTAGQDTQRAFASFKWDLRRLTPWGQEVTFTAFGRGDVYHASDVGSTGVASYRGLDGWQTRAIGALAVDVKWPFIGTFLSGTQRFTPRVQVVASPHIANIDIPNEDARAIDLEDSNPFALNRFPGYDRFEDSSRVTYGADWAVDLPGISVNATIGQSYRLDSRPSLFLNGTGLTDRFSDIVGRTEIRFHDFVSLTHRYRLDKDTLTVRRNELDATIGSRSTYLLLGYLRLNRDITPILEDLQDREEARIGGRVQIRRFWSVFGSTVIDLTDRAEDPLSIADGFSPVRHRLGVQYEDDCLRLGVTWKRDYQNTGDAQRGNSYLLTLAFKNLGR